MEGTSRTALPSFHNYKGDTAMWMYLLPVIIGVTAALFSDKIQNPELKKVILVFSAGTIAVCIIAAVASVIA